VRAIDPIRGVTVFIAQILAGIAASAVADGLTPGPALFANRLGGGATPVQGLFLETFLTAQLVLTVYFLAVEKHRATFLAPVGIGMSVFVAHICATHWTGTSINPARSFGPDVIVGFAHYHWIYWVGPLLGALLAYAVYTLLNFMRYQLANPGQDSDVVVIIERGGGAQLPLTHTADDKHVFSVGDDADTGVGMPPPSPTAIKKHHRIDSTLSEATHFEHL
jgi:aquaporin rerated protein, other eukaryote